MSCRAAVNTNGTAAPCRSARFAIEVDAPCMLTPGARVWREVGGSVNVLEAERAMADMVKDSEKRRVARNFGWRRVRVVRVTRAGLRELMDGWEASLEGERKQETGDRAEVKA